LYILYIENPSKWGKLFGDGTLFEDNLSGDNDFVDTHILVETILFENCASSGDSEYIALLGVI
jgi:hypothetical protein